MAKSTRTMFFAVKLVAQSVGKQQSKTVSVPETFITKHALDHCDEKNSGGSPYLRIGGKPGTSFHGIAGHFTAHFLDFSDKEDSKCKTLAEAEQLVRKTHKDWLADAYDWYVAPAEIDTISQLDGKAAKAAKSVKRSKK